MASRYTLLAAGQKLLYLGRSNEPCQCEKPRDPEGGQKGCGVKIEVRLAEPGEELWRRYGRKEEVELPVRQLLEYAPQPHHRSHLFLEGLPPLRLVPLQP